MKNHSFKRVVSALLVTLIFLSFTTFVSADTTANVDFFVIETNEGNVELKLSVKNATFAALLAAIRYNPEALQPIDGNFTSLSDEADSFGVMNLANDSEKGFCGVILYAKSEKTSEDATEKKEFTADSKGVDLYTFRFKKISDQSFDFEIADKSETKPYQASIPEGLQVLSYSKALEAKVTFNYQDQSPVETVVTPILRAPEVETITSKERKQDVICLQIGKSLSIAHGKKTLIDPENPLVVPYISNDRTLVPLRFVSETLGAEVIWVEGQNGCTIKKGDTEIELTFGSAEFKVNGKPVIYDAPIEITNDRTMVPVRFVSEQLNCDVYWNELNKAVVIAPKDNPWIKDRKAEITALNEMLVTLLGII